MPKLPKPPPWPVLNQYAPVSYPTRIPAWARHPKALIMDIQTDPRYRGHMTRCAPVSLN